MEQNNDNNHLRIPSDSQSDHSNNENILKTMNDEVFKHSIEIFKRAKKNLNH